MLFAINIAMPCRNPPCSLYVSQFAPGTSVSGTLLVLATADWRIRILEKTIPMRSGSWERTEESGKGELSEATSLRVANSPLERAREEGVRSGTSEGDSRRVRCVRAQRGGY